MSRYLPDVPRHAIFGDEATENKLYIVPENEVYITIIKEANRTKMIVTFKGRTVTLPQGSAVQFEQLKAITATGGIGFAAANPEAPIANLKIPGRPS